MTHGWWIVVRRDPGPVDCGYVTGEYRTLPPPIRGREEADRAAIQWESAEGWGARVGPDGRLRRVRYSRVVGPYPTRDAARRAVKEKRS
jgi:hypothetical protein